MNCYDIKNLINTKEFGKNIFYFDKIDSTNNEAKRSINNGISHGDVFIAENQTNGRGRMGRNWISSRGNGIYMSVVAKQDACIDELPKITLASGLAVCKAINSVVPCKAVIKWPNDILIAGKKICGILTELVHDSDNTYAIIGIGINVNNVYIPDEIKYKASSILIQTGQKYSRTKLIVEILNNMEIYYSRYKNNDKTLIDEYKTFCLSIGKTVFVNKNNQQIIGKVIDISSSGRLIVKSDNSVILEINSGEVSIQGIY